MNLINKTLILFIVFQVIWNQEESGDIYRRYGIHNGNLVRTVFSNWGVVGQPGDKGPRGAWLDDNNGYIGDVSLLVGAEVTSPNQNGDNVTFHSVVTCPVDRPSQSGPDQSNSGLRWGFEPVAGYLNSSQLYVAMSTNQNTWPNYWPDEDCNWGGEWCGYFGKDTQYIQQESYYVMNDNNDEEFNYSSNNQWGVAFKPDVDNSILNGLGLEVKVRGMQWQQILAQDCIFFLYEITNKSQTEYKKVVLGELVGTYIGNVETEADDDWSFFDVNSDLAYTGDYDNMITNNPNWVGNVGMVGYAFLESPGNPYDGIDNDGDFDGVSNIFNEGDFESRIINIGDFVVTINDDYKRTKVEIVDETTILISQGIEFTIVAGETSLIEGNEIDGETVNENAFNGLDDDLDGLIDENYYLHYRQKRVFYDESTGLEQTLFDIVNPRAYINYTDYDNVNGFIEENLSDLIDERRDDGVDNDNDWIQSVHDVGTDGLAGTSDSDGTEGNGIPDLGEPNFDKTDPDESDQIGLTSFDYFVPSSAYPMSDDEELWNKLSPGFFDVPESIQNGQPTAGEDGDFIFGSGYFPLMPGQTERFSIALIYGEDKFDLDRNKEIVQEIYDNDYQFPPPPAKPTLTAVPGDSKVTLYWDRVAETTIDPVLLEYDFQGYKIYRATDPNFNDVRNITNAYGIIEDYSPLMQFDLADDIDSLFYPSYELFQQSGGLSFNLGDSTGLMHSFEDTGLINGRTYYYALSAYDSGNPNHTYPSENTKYITVLPTGEIITDKNTAIATPTTSTMGYNTDDMDLDYSGSGTGSVAYTIIDETKITGHEYLIEFWDSSNDDVDNNLNNLIDNNDVLETIPITTFYSVLDNQTISLSLSLSSYDTTYFDLGYKNIIEDSFVLEMSSGNTVSDDNYIINYDLGDIKINSDILPNDFEIHFSHYPIFKSPYIKGAKWDFNLLNNDNDNLADDYEGTTVWIEEVQDSEVFDGLSLDFNNDWDIFFSEKKWILNGDEVISNENILDIAVDTLSYPQFNLKAYASPNDYMIVFNDNSSFSEDLNGTSTNFKVFDITNDLELDYQFLGSQSNNEIDHLDRIYLFEDYPLNENMYTWNIEFSYFPSQQESQPILQFGDNDTLFIYTSKPFRYGDEFLLKTNVPNIDYDSPNIDLSNIKVVPNPYIASTAIESSLPPGISSGRGERKIEFQNVPNDAIIKIFNIRGQHIVTLKHDGNIFDGSVSWNLRTKENMDIAYGVYLYVIESDLGVKKGKIAIIK